MFEYDKIKKLKHNNIILLLDNIYQQKNSLYFLYMYKIYISNHFAPIGFISFGINPPKEKEHLGNIGYRIHKKYRKNGYATDACIAMLNMLRKNNIKSTIITCDKNHVATSKICKKIGGILTKESHLKFYYTIIL